MEQELANTTDPLRIQDLLEARTMVKRRFAGEQGQRRRQIRERLHPRQADEIIQPNGEILEPVTPNDVDRIAQSVGVSKEGTLDPTKVLSSVIMKRESLGTIM